MRDTNSIEKGSAARRSPHVLAVAVVIIIIAIAWANVAADFEWFAAFFVPFFFVIVLYLALKAQTEKVKQAAQAAGPPKPKQPRNEDDVLLRQMRRVFNTSRSSTEGRKRNFLPRPRRQFASPTKNLNRVIAVQITFALVIITLLTFFAYCQIEQCTL